MDEPAKSRVFLSYRREETKHAAGRLADRIAERFSSSQVFVDVDSIPPGVDFSEATQEAVSGCDVLLALIGPRWTTIEDGEGRRRLDDPEDFVVLELRAALDRGIPVIPVLVDGAQMPKRAELPAGLERFTRRNAVRLDAETFRQDVGWLLDELAKMLPAQTGDATEARPAPAGTRLSRRAALRLAGGMLAVAASGAGAWGVSRSVRSERDAPIWSFTTGDEVYSSPAVLGDVVFVGSSDKHLYAINAGTGEEIWRYATDGAVTSSPAVADGVVYVGCDDKKVHAVDAATGANRWIFRTGGAIHSSPAVDRGVAYIGCRDNNLYAIDVAAGERRWRFRGGDWFNSSPVVADGAVYVGCRDRNVYA